MKNKIIKWTEFWDMHSGGGTKEAPYEKIYINASEEEARIIFYNRFGHSAERVSCTCCGEDYSVSESDSLEEATRYHRVKLKISLSAYEKQMDVLVIYDKDIKPSERSGDVPQQGYVWR